MNRYLLIIIAIMLILFSCIKGNNINIKFTSFYEAIIDVKANKIAENNIAGFKKGVFSSSYKIDDLKNAYLKNGYILDKENENILKKDNITIKLINIDNNYVNILIDIKP